MIQQLLICFENVGKKIVLCFVIHPWIQPEWHKSKFEWCIQWRRRTVNNTGDEALFFLHFDSIKRVVNDKNTSPFGRITKLRSIGLLNCKERWGEVQNRTWLLGSTFKDPYPAVHWFQFVLWILVLESHFVIQNLKRAAWCNCRLICIGWGKWLL